MQNKYNEKDNYDIVYDNYDFVNDKYVCIKIINVSIGVV